MSGSGEAGHAEIRHAENDRAMRVSGIVLAGGGSVRFGSNKLDALVGGAPLIHRPIRALASVCDEVVVVVGASGVPSLPDHLRVPLRIVRDDEHDAGPLAGVCSGLAEATCEIALVVGGDMPALVETVLMELARRLSAPSRDDAAVLLDGRRQRPLPAALRVEPCLAAARSLRARGEARLRALLEAVATDAIPKSTWRVLDPDGRSLLDIDAPADLALFEALP